MSPSRPTNPNTPGAAALLRYVSGESPLSEAEMIRQWAGADRDRAASIEELRAAWQLKSADALPWDKDGVWAKLAAAMDTPAPIASQVKSARPRLSFTEQRSRLPVPMAIAASLLLIASGTCVVLRNETPKTVAAVSHVAEMREIRTTRGQQAVLDLADGSRVILAADSHLRVPANFDVPSPRGRRRELELVGKGYFEVTHDGTRPFLVRTATAVTEDIGTAFIISAYPESPATLVGVKEGSVSLRRRTSSERAGVPQSAASIDSSMSPLPLMVLRGGQAARLDAAGTATLTRDVSVDVLTAWTKGVLIFDGVLLRDAIADLARWYDVDIQLANRSLETRHLTATLRNESANEAFRKLGLILGADVRRNGRTVVLSARSTR